MTRTILLAALLLSACGGRRAIVGTITDHRGEPLDRVLVRLDPGNLEIVSDREGGFRIDYLRDDQAARIRLRPRTTYTLELFKPGFHVVSRPVAYRRGHLDLGTIALVPDVLRVQDDGQNLVPALDGGRTTGDGATYEGQ